MKERKVKFVKVDPCTDVYAIGDVATILNVLTYSKEEQVIVVCGDEPHHCQQIVGLPYVRYLNNKEVKV